MAELEGLLGGLRHGAAREEFEARLREVIAAVQDTGKQGEVTVTLKLGLYNNTDVHTLEVTDSIKAKVPQHPIPKTLMHPDRETGLLTRRDPRQPSLKGTDPDGEEGQGGETQGEPEPNGKVRHIR